MIWVHAYTYGSNVESGEGCVDALFPFGHNRSFLPIPPDVIATAKQEASKDS
jgi:hypothetical protein